MSERMRAVAWVDFRFAVPRKKTWTYSRRDAEMFDPFHICSDGLRYDNRGK